MQADEVYRLEGGCVYCASFGAHIDFVGGMQLISAFGVPFEELVSPEHLKLIYMGKVRRSTAVGLDKISVAKFDTILDEEVALISRKVLTGTYSFTPYRQRIESKGAGKLPRVLSIPTIRDRVTLKALSEAVVNEFGHKANTPSPQEVIRDIIAVVQSQERTGYIKLDLSDFYGTIKHDKMLRRLRASSIDPRAIDLIDKALATPTHSYYSCSSDKNERGLPQGIAIANSLANVYASTLDEAIKGMQGVAAYHRYVDDILVLCDGESAKSLLNEIADKIEKASLVINKDKTRYGVLPDDSIDFLGYVVGDGLVTARDSSKTKIEMSLERQIKAISKKQKSGDAKEAKSLMKQLERRITGCFVSNDGVRYQRYGWLFYFSRMTDVGYLVQLDRLIQKLCARYDVKLPAEIPTFKKAYYQMRYNARDSRLFPRYSYNDASDVKKRNLEEDFYGPWDLNLLGDDELDRAYTRELNALVRGLERDIGSFS